MRYTVVVDDNRHFADEEFRGEAGPFDTLEEAIAEAKEIVMISLRDVYHPGISAEELYSLYKNWGEDPHIRPDVINAENPLPNFSAWKYAGEQCEEMCK